MSGDQTTGKDSHGGTQVSALDRSALRELRDLLGDDRDALAELVDAFADEAPQRLAELRAAANDGDAELLERAAHTLKSNARTFGAGELAALCGGLEAAGRAGALDGTAGPIAAVEAEWPRVRSELLALLAEGAP